MRARVTTTVACLAASAWILGAYDHAASQTRTAAAAPAPSSSRTGGGSSSGGFSSSGGGFLGLLQEATRAAAQAQAAKKVADAAKSEADRKAAQAAQAEADRKAAQDARAQVAAAQAAQAAAEQRAAAALAQAAQAQSQLAAADAARKAAQAAQAKAIADRRAAAAAAAAKAAQAGAATAPAPQGPGQVDWIAAVGGARQTAGAQGTLGPKLDQSAVDRTRVPILLPVDPGLMATARIYSFGDYYTITADLQGAGVSLTGTTALVTLPPTTKLRIKSEGLEGLTLQRTIDGQLASFLRYGVLYTVELRCDAPTDVRCRTDDFVRGLVSKMSVVVLGKAARKAAGMGG